MDFKEFNLHNKLIKFGITPKILELLPFKPEEIIPFYDEGFILESSQGSKALWFQRGREASLACQIELLEICQQHGFDGFLYPLALNDHRYYAELDEERWFYLTTWSDLRKIYFSSWEDIKAVINLLADFRSTFLKRGFLFSIPDRRPNNLLLKYQESFNQLISFGMLAKHRLRPTEFDKIFLSYLPELLQQSKQAINIIENSDYFELLSKLTPKDIIINNLTRHNIKMTVDGKAVCLRLNAYQWNLPIIDLAILLIKTGRSGEWSENWYLNIINEYQQYFKINPSELQIIYSYLTFPWSIYRLASRYYFNRVEWTVRSFIDKMERLLGDEGKRVGFLKNLPI